MKHLRGSTQYIQNAFFSICLYCIFCIVLFPLLYILFNGSDMGFDNTIGGA